jgi:hypothetical protein
VVAFDGCDRMCDVSLSVVHCGSVSMGCAVLYWEDFYGEKIK